VSSWRETIRTLGCLQAVTIVFGVWLVFKYLPQIVATFSAISNGKFDEIVLLSSYALPQNTVFRFVTIESRHYWSYTECGPKKSHIMLKLTKKADYGLMALKYLAERPDTVALSAKDIADAYGIPAQLLAKILQQLTKSGMLKSHAGMNGGYALSKPASSISAYEVILAIDGPFFITSCTKGAKGCDLTPSCTIKEPLARVNETIAGVLKSISIQDLAEHEHAPSPTHEHKLVSLTV